MESSILNNCVVYYNTAGFSQLGGNYSYLYSSLFNSCCTTPMPTNGIGNITNEPAFVNRTHSDFHLEAVSRCINAGNNAYVSITNDLDGNPRIMGGAVDLGAYEFQAQVTGTFSNWLQQYSLPTDGSADSLDADGDGMVNWQEWLAGTEPNNPLSVLKVFGPVFSSSSGITITWSSVANRIYTVQRGTALAAPLPFSILQNNLAGQSGSTSFTDTTATNGGPYFYRVGVQ